MTKPKTITRTSGVLELYHNHSILQWILTGSVFLFLFLAPFQRGLFNGGEYTFERPIFSFLIFGFAVLLMFSVHLFTQWGLRDTRDVLALFVWIIPLCYWISSFQAASHHFAKNLVYINFAYAAAFVLGCYLCRTASLSSIIQSGFIGSGYMVVVFGLMNWFGDASLFGLINWSELPDQVSRVYKDAVHIDANGERLTSVFQYANTYSAFLIAFMLIALFRMTSGGKWYWLVLHGAMLTLMWDSFFLTLSRGGIVVFPIVLLLILPFLALSRQIMFFAHLLVSFVGALVILPYVTNTGLTLQKQFQVGVAFQAWFILLIVALICGGASYFIQRYAGGYLQRKLEAFELTKKSRWIAPISAVIFGVIAVFLVFGNTGVIELFPDNIQTRLENINFQQHSVLERGTFYKDALKIVGDHPIFGAGGGAWAALYEKYQNNPYLSRQAHNFYLQYLVEVGIVGFAVFTIFMLLLLRTFIKNYIRSPENRESSFIYFIIVVALLTHSLIDFNMSYVYLSVIVFFSMGAMLAPFELTPISRLAKFASSRWHKAFPSATGVLSVVLLIVSLQLLNSNSAFSKARTELYTTQNFQTITENVDRALEIYPTHWEYNNFKIDIMTQAYKQFKDEAFYNEAVSVVQSIKQKEPYNHIIFNKELDLTLMKGDRERAIQLLTEGKDKFPWGLDVYENLITLHYQSGMDSQSDNDQTAADSHWNAAIGTYRLVLDRIELLKQLPEGQDQGRNPFLVTDRMALAVGHIYFIKGDYANAATVLKANITADLSKNDLIRLYLASMIKQNQNDTELYNQFIAAYPDEKQKIDTIAGSPQP